MSNNGQKEEKDKKAGINDPVLELPKKGLVTCPNCKEKIEPKDGICPECRHYIGEGKAAYQPMSPKTIKKIRLILTFVFLGVFIVLVALGAVKLQGCQFN